jgi:cell division protease FtsH
MNKRFFLGRSVSQQKNLSDNTASIVDNEIRRISDEVYNDAEKILKKYSKQLKKVAEALLEFETLNGDQILKICKGIKISLPKKDDVNINTPKARKPKKRAGLPSITDKGTIVTNEINDSKG